MSAQLGLSRNFRDQYPDPHRIMLSQRGNMSGMKHTRAGGVIQSKGRGQVATPQSLIVISTTVAKDELGRRARVAPMDERQMYAPPAKSQNEMVVQKGLLGIGNPGHNDLPTGAR